MDDAVKYVCEHCGSDDVLADAYAEWNDELQTWEVANVFDKGAHCHACDGETRLEEVPADGPAADDEADDDEA